MNSKVHNVSKTTELVGKDQNIYLLGEVKADAEGRYVSGAEIPFIFKDCEAI